MGRKEDLYRVTPAVVLRKINNSTAAFDKSSIGIYAKTSAGNNLPGVLKIQWASFKMQLMPIQPLPNPLMPPFSVITQYRNMPPITSQSVGNCPMNGSNKKSMRANLPSPIIQHKINYNN